MQSITAKICFGLNLISLLSAIPIVHMARKALYWSGAAENEAAYNLLFFGWIILGFQLLLMMAVVFIAVRQYLWWSGIDKLNVIVSMPAGCLVSMIAIYIGLR